MKKRILLVMGVMTILIFPTSVFAGHFSGISSVDGKEIRYEDYTSYDDAKQWAIDKWNALGKVNIAPDAWWTYSDLYFMDIDDPLTPYPAYWDSRTYVHQLVFNTDKLKTKGDFYRRLAATHEMGHALGIDDHYESEYYYTLMYYAATTVNVPTTHDKEDYNTLWK
jgi:predicted Zn-dependent protease